MRAPSFGSRLGRWPVPSERDGASEMLKVGGGGGTGWGVRRKERLRGRRWGWEGVDRAKREAVH